MFILNFDIFVLMLCNKNDNNKFKMLLKSSPSLMKFNCNSKYDDFYFNIGFFGSSNVAFPILAHEKSNKTK